MGDGQVAGDLLAGGAARRPGRRRDAVRPPSASSRSSPGVLLLGAIAGGVLWSNFLQYRNVTLAPRARLSELQTIGTHARRARARRSSTSTRSTATATSCAPARRSSRPSTASADLPTLGNALLTKPRLGQHRLVRPGHAGALPLAGDPRRPDREPAAVDLHSCVWRGPLLPALAAARAPDAARDRSTSRSATRSPTPTAARASNAALQPALPDRAGRGAGLLAGRARSAARRPPTTRELRAYERTNPIVRARAPTRSGAGGCGRPTPADRAR